ncbi:hypothetical protein FSP39_012196 [Pinctada imbricata]|uniref:Retinoid-inducible serine carboxypeptidase n=1 Tax=Pinctada imbricata TaxID=66713 RepID=A0AA88XXV7_PINIB|nr:hypothetical protein FSP39_012196 [Pinctada imbricata]
MFSGKLYGDVPIKNGLVKIVSGKGESPHVSCACHVSLFSRGGIMELEKVFIFIVVINCCLYSSESKIEERGASGLEEWAYVTVRPQAHMFYWLYKHPHSTQVPLILWLQGGPGGSSAGFGNFEELGPLDVKLQPRNTTWLSVASLLFVDNPVGAGFSYVDSEDAYTTDVNMIAADMLTLLKNFFMDSQAGKDLQNVPFYIFCESYGGKMTAAISDVLYQAVKDNEVNCKFMGLALGDSWIHPFDSTSKWAPYLLTNSLIDENGYKEIQGGVEQLQQCISDGAWGNATGQWGNIQDLVVKYTGGVNFYNILKWGVPEQGFSHRYFTKTERLTHRMLDPLHSDPLTDLMNGPIRKKLKIIPDKVKWGAQSEMVFVKMTEDFMKPVVDIVDKLIQTTDLRVVVYSGQLDLIVGTPGTEQWVETLKIFPDFFAVKRSPMKDSKTDVVCAYKKTLKNFSFYWILSAGHMVPQDNGNCALDMVKQIIHSKL